MEQRADRRLVERRLTELRTDRRDLNSKRSTRQRVDIDGQRRTSNTLRANDIRTNQKEQRDTERAVLIFSRDRSLNDIKRSRSVDREYVRSVDRDSRSRRQSNSRDLSEDSTFIRRRIRSSRLQERNSRIPVNTRSLAMRDKVLTHNNNEYVPGMGGTEFLKQESHVISFDIIRQAFVIGLCTMYGLSIFYGKRSFIR